MARTPCVAHAASTCARSSCSASGVGARRTLPSAASRSSTPKRSVASTSGAGSRGCSAYSARPRLPPDLEHVLEARAWSPAPSARRAARAARWSPPSSSATSSSMGVPAASWRAPSSTGSPGSAGVDGSLATRTTPAPSTATTSVKVPPVSTPTRSVTRARAQVLLRRRVELLVELGAEGVDDDALARAIQRVVLGILVDEAGERRLVGVSSSGSLSKSPSVARA